ncbi:hypothetical protein MTAT_20220 [Moorella thermoacetica]|uniref:Uncharacterized protein n=1 Tax=Neomoorella thermoacetica TaxID=1525 RepID=A0AAC9MVQ8_NEOTH|nr:hypothetical protein [Moorella thermoacetica]AOQ24677.1 hypothetical protein Maut_02249 [Moorella thermoacetica]TYL12780.1 hypothetical protein MTAT_20220 [Moorella thermoacetica]
MSKVFVTGLREEAPEENSAVKTYVLCKYGDRPCIDPELRGKNCHWYTSEDGQQYCTYHPIPQAAMQPPTHCPEHETLLVADGNALRCPKCDWNNYDPNIEEVEKTMAQTKNIQNNQNKEEKVMTQTAQEVTQDVTVQKELLQKRSLIIRNLRQAGLRVNPKEIKWFSKGQFGIQGIIVRPFHVEGSRTVAFITVIFEHMALDGFRLVSWKKSFFVAPPSRQGKSKSGKVQYYNTIFCSREMLDVIRDATLMVVKDVVVA